MKRLAIIGAGDLGRQIAYHAVADKHFHLIGFFDDFQKRGELIDGYPVLGGLDDIEIIYRGGHFDVLLVGIGYKHFLLRENVFDRFSPFIPFGSLIHSSAYVDRSCHIGDGTIIYPGCTLDMNVVIGNNTLINAGCIIAHDSRVGNHAFLSPGVNVAGFVSIGDSTKLGIGTIVIDNVSVGVAIQTGAGAVVVESLVAKGLYIGVPAKFKRDI